jgi:RHS repeat-associated protein
VWDTRFYYHTAAPLYSYLFESDNDKTMTVAYTVGPRGNLISQRRSGATSYHLYDQLGSTRRLLDSSQVTTDTYSYYAFGEVRTSSGSTANPFKFVGQLGYYSDGATAFDYVRARYYAPGWGRFASVDPVEKGARAYVYTDGNPLARVDATGLFKFCLGTSWLPSKEYQGHPTSDWTGWHLYNSACCPYPPLEPLGYKLWCYWENSRKWEGRVRECRWYICWEVGVKPCRYSSWSEQHCWPWQAATWTETKTVPLDYINECGPEELRAQWDERCKTHGGPPEPPGLVVP